MIHINVALFSVCTTQRRSDCRRWKGGLDRILSNTRRIAKLVHVKQQPTWFDKTNHLVES